MAEPIPKWMQIKFSQLWQAFEGKDFTMAECQAALQENKREVVAVVLSRLKAKGWLHVTPNPSDNRKKMYRFDRLRIVKSFNTVNDLSRLCSYLCIGIICRWVFNVYWRDNSINPKYNSCCDCFGNSIWGSKNNACKFCGWNDIFLLCEYRTSIFKVK